MKKRTLILLVASVLAAVVAVAAYYMPDGNGIYTSPAYKELHRKTNAVYYWRTTFSLSQWERNFLKNNNVGRMYVRMFDVVETNGKQPVPNATIKFEQEIPEGMEIVPTVFITVPAMEQIMYNDTTGVIACKLVERIKAMCSRHDIKNWHEIQLDCDWNEYTGKAFYRFCEQVKKQLGNDILLSSTIRLHQLSQPAPPVDYGVLMVYNTGNFRDYDEPNSILRSSEVKKYLDVKIDCNIHLDIALPAFQWYRVFEDGFFQNLSYTPQASGAIHERAEYSEIMKAKELVRKNLSKHTKNSSIIIYQLTEDNLKYYNNAKIKNIYAD